MRDLFAYFKVISIFASTLIHILLKMKKAKIIFGLLALTIFSLSFVSNNSSNDDENQKQSIERHKIQIPTNG